MTNQFGDCGFIVMLYTKFLRILHHYEVISMFLMADIRIQPPAGTSERKYHHLQVRSWFAVGVRNKFAPHLKAQA